MKTRWLSGWVLERCYFEDLICFQYLEQNSLFSVPCRSIWLLSNMQKTNNFISRSVPLAYQTTCILMKASWIKTTVITAIFLPPLYIHQAAALCIFWHRRIIFPNSTKPDSNWFLRIEQTTEISCCLALL